MASGNAINSAIRKGYFQQVRFLVDQGCDVNARDSNGYTPLILCSMISNETWSTGLARLLLENGARISVYDQQGYNALHHACINEREKLVEVFLSALDCHIHSKCKKGNTSLHYAASVGNLDIVKLLSKLLVRFKVKLDPKNKNGLTPLHQAWKANNLDCGDLLVEYGADVTILDCENKSAVQLREEAVSRLEQTNEKSQTKSASRRIKRQKEVVDTEQPKRSDLKIHVAKDFDLRNNPEYVFNMSAVEYFQLKMMMQPKTSHQTKQHSKQWQDELLRLWKVYEIQCSNALRSSAQPLKKEEIHSSSRRKSSQAGHNHQLIKRTSRMSLKSRSGSTASLEASPRKSSQNSRRGGMPPLVRAQSRASFN